MRRFSGVTSGCLVETGAMRLFRLGASAFAALAAVAFAAGCSGQAVKEIPPGLGAPANAASKPAARRCVTVTVPALMNGQVTSTGTDTCIIAGQTFTTTLYENGKIVDSQSGPCVSGCQEVVLHICNSDRRSHYYAVAESNKFPKVRSKKVRLACQ